jgi:cytochrome c nitrite reductase small subunit
LRCHQNIFYGIKSHAGELGKQMHKGRKCTECHRETPHGTVNSLSSVPYARVPLLKSPVPLWVQNFIKTSGN